MLMQRFLQSSDGTAWKGMGGVQQVQGLLCAVGCVPRAGCGNLLGGVLPVRDLVGVRFLLRLGACINARTAGGSKHEGLLDSVSPAPRLSVRWPQDSLLPREHPGRPERRQLRGALAQWRSWVLSRILPRCVVYGSEFGCRVASPISHPSPLAFRPAPLTLNPSGTLTPSNPPAGHREGIVVRGVAGDISKKIMVTETLFATTNAY